MRRPLCPSASGTAATSPESTRAPVGRNAEGQFFLFCFEHVKAYNKGYNYFEGLSDSEIARYQKELTGHRPPGPSASTAIPARRR